MEKILLLVKLNKQFKTPFDYGKKFIVTKLKTECCDVFLAH